MSKSTKPTAPHAREEIRNVKIVRVNIKVSWEPSCCQLVTIYFNDPEGDMSRRYDSYDGKETVLEPYFTIPFFSGADRHTGRIHTSLVALAWVLDQGMYLKAEDSLLRIKAEFHEGHKGCNIKAIGNIMLDRWLKADSLPDIPYPYCISKKEYVPE